jgi:hypothetical protein
MWLHVQQALIFLFSASFFMYPLLLLFSKCPGGTLQTILRHIIVTPIESMLAHPSGPNSNGLLATFLISIEIFQPLAVESIRHTGLGAQTASATMDTIKVIKPLSWKLLAESTWQLLLQEDCCCSHGGRHGFPTSTVNTEHQQSSWYRLCMQ